MRPKTGLVVRAVTQLVGGIGDARGQIDTARLVDRFANLTGARPVLFQPPGVVKNQAVQRALLRDRAVTDVLEAWKRLTVALMGVGSVQGLASQRSSAPADGHEQADLGRLGAVAHVCLRLLDEDGNLVESPFNGRVVGMGPERLKAVPRRIGVAGGPQERAAVAAAIKGGWINTLITDLSTAGYLLRDAARDNG